MVAKQTKYWLAYRSSETGALPASLKRARESLRRKVLRQSKKQPAKTHKVLEPKRKSEDGIKPTEPNGISSQTVVGILKRNPLRSSIGKVGLSTSRNKCSISTATQRQTNPFFVFLDHYRKFLYKTDSSVIFQKKLTKRAGEYWHQLTPAAKYVYKGIARNNRVKKQKERNQCNNDCKVPFKLVK